MTRRRFVGSHTAALARNWSSTASQQMRTRDARMAARLVHPGGNEAYTDDVVDGWIRTVVDTQKEGEQPVAPMIEKS